MKIKEELHQAMHDRNLYSHEAVRGAYFAVDFLVASLALIPREYQVETIEGWYKEMLEELKERESHD